MIDSRTAIGVGSTYIFKTVSSGIFPGAVLSTSGRLTRSIIHRPSNHRRRRRRRHRRRRRRRRRRRCFVGLVQPIDHGDSLAHPARDLVLAFHEDAPLANGKIDSLVTRRLLTAWC